MKLFHDKHLALLVFFVLLAVYIWKPDETIKTMAITIFGVFCSAITDGFKRSNDFFKAKVQTDFKKEDKKDVHG